MPRKPVRPTAPSQRANVDPATYKGALNVPDHVKSARLDEVEILMASGASPQQIADHCRVEYGLADRTARDYQLSVRKRWAEESVAARPEIRRKLERMLEICYQSALQAKPPLVHAGIRAAVELARLHGLYRPGEAPDNREPDQHTHLHAHATVVQIDARGMTPIERNAEIERLEAKRRLALGPMKRPAAKQRLAEILEGKATP